MAVQTITLSLSDSVINRARLAASVLQLPLEEMLADVLDAALPTVADAPVEMQADLARMTWLDDQTLWTIARSEMPSEKQERLHDLTLLQHQRVLNREEERVVDDLRQEYGSTTLRKARAFALLSMRSGRPLLAEN
jgi:hypothetical protein